MLAFAIIKPFVKTALKIVSFILYIVTILSAFGGHVDPEIIAFPSTLTLAFPYLAWLTFIVAAIWMLTRNFITGGLGLLAIFVCWGNVKASALPMGTPKEAEADEKEFTVLSYNIMGGRDNEQTEVSNNRQAEYILSSDADIVCIQEVYHLEDIPNLTQQQADSLRKRYPYELPDMSTMLMLLSKYPAEKIEYTDIESPYNGFFDAYEINIEGNPVTLINVHLASYTLDAEEREVVQDMRSVEGVKEGIEEMRSKTFRGKMGESFRRRAINAADIRRLIDSTQGPLIICGDFNDVPTSWAYRTIKGDDLNDAYTQTNFLHRPTFNDHLFYFHIDQMLYRPADKLRALDMNVGSLKASDHYPIEAKFAIN